PDLAADAPALPGQADVDPDLPPGLDGQPGVEEADRHDRHAGAAVGPVLQAHDAALPRGKALGPEHDLEHGHGPGRLGRIATGDGAMPARHRLDVLGRVVGPPGAAIVPLEFSV